MPLVRPRGADSGADSVVEAVPAVLEGFTVESRLEVRLVEREDLLPLHAVDREVFGELAYPYFALRQLFDAHSGEILVARIDGRLCGYSLTMTSRTSDIGWFQGLGVVPGLRGHRIGRRLACDALTLLFEHGIQHVRLAVREENIVATNLYESLGFHRTSKEVDYFGSGENRVLMTCRLTQAIIRSWSAEVSSTPVRTVDVGAVAPDRADAPSTPR